MAQRIRVLVVDDSVFFRTAISKGLELHPDIEVIGTASSAFEARDKIVQMKPDVLTLDVEMPKINGIQLLKMMMPQRPMPVVVVSAVDGIVFEALHAGAVDFVEKPGRGGSAAMKAFTEDLAEKVVIASKVTFDKEGKKTVQGNTPAGVVRRTAAVPAKDRLIAIGASTGGTEATSAILKTLPASMPGIVITQHMPPTFTKMYAQRLDRECALSVKEAEDGDQVVQGHAYVAPGDKQMRVIKKNGVYTIRCEEGPKVSGHCPSVDVLFSSVAQFADRNTVGVILTGMGKDGAKGLLAMREKGAYTIGQDEASCVVYGMPMVAYNMNAVVRQCGLSEIPDTLINYLMRGK